MTTQRSKTRIASTRLALMVVAGIAMLALSTPTRAQTPTPTPGGDCCAVHGGPGCNNSACQTCVCADQNGGDFCCSGSWDATCVDIAKNVGECAPSCPCTPNPTPTPGTGTPTPTPGGDCCSGHAGASCDSSSCTACVCATPGQDVCCTQQWDSTCASVAAIECAGQCPCGTGECCAAHDFPGCESTLCEQCVCGKPGQEFCCTDQWDGTCADVAHNECSSVCPCSANSCCTTHGDPGCEGAVCIDCVCGLDPGCCSDTAAWDADCVVIARSADQCLGRCGCSESDCCGTSDDPGCSSAVCTDCICTQDQDCCIDSWDQTCVDEATDDNLCAGSCACFTNECCSAHPEPGCSEPDCVDCVCTIDPACCTEGWDATCAQEAMTAIECSGRCPCASGDCCAARDTPGCQSEGCRDCVCNVDQECCTLVWDQTCVEIASSVDCGAQCPCLTGSDCCRAQNAPGCENGTCAACVCAVDGQDTCCSGVWDAQCADVATHECAASCPCGSCPGDCDGGGSVGVSELVLGVNISLGRGNIADCTAFDTNDSGTISIDELIAAVNRALHGC